MSEVGQVQLDHAMTTKGRAPARRAWDDGQWLLAHAKTGQELVARAHLQRQGYEVLLPLERRTVRHARRVSQSLSAYFPGYLFVRVDAEGQRWRPINSTVGIIRVVSGPAGPTPAPAALIEALSAACDETGVMSLAPAWGPGDKVCLAAGPFADRLATVEAMRGPDRAQLLLAMMHGNARVVVRTTDLRGVG